MKSDFVPADTVISFFEVFVRYTGHTVFAQLLAVVPFSHFEHLVEKYRANRWTRDFTAWGHFIRMVYAQLTRREGLRDLIVCLNSQSTKLYHCGLRQGVSRSTLADANERCDSHLFESLGQRLIEIALDLYKDHDIRLGLKEPLYAMDSTTIDLCLKLFPWADFRSTKAGIKAHKVIDLRGSIPVMLLITTGKVSDVEQPNSLSLPKGSTVVRPRLHGLCQHFFGNSLNAVRSQIWIAVCTYLIASVAHYRLHTELSLRNFLHLVEVNMFEKVTLAQMVDNALKDESFEALKSQHELF